jgi:hypothetical protein
VVSYLLVALLAGSAVAGPSDDVWMGAAPSQVRAELLTLTDDTRGFAIHNQRGWSLTAADAAWLFGDKATYALANQVRHRHRTVGALLLTGGPIFMIAGAVQLDSGGWQRLPYLEGVGVGSVIGGTVALVAGLAMLVDPRPIRPATFYTRDQAEALVGEHNRRLLAPWAPQGADATAPRPRVHVALGAAPLRGGGALAATFTW